MEYILNQDQELISHLAISSVKSVCDYLDIKTSFAKSSLILANNHLSSVDRILDICVKETCQVYINAIGGASLYSKDTFLSKNINLKFLQSKEVQYKQFTDTFYPWLSIIDVLMHNPKDEAQRFLNEYQLL